jgi:hypothetical protein
MRPTDQEIAALLLRASWQVQGVGFQLSADERERMALQMRDLATRLVPIRTTENGPTEPSERRHGAYTGD